MKFDLVITNPPYNNYIDLNILESLHDISNEFIVIHPCPYLMKNTFDTNDTLKEFINRTSGTVKSIEFFDGWDTFAIENPSPCVIIHYNKKLATDCDVSFTQDNFFGYKSVPYKVKSLLDITYFGESYETIVKPFEKIISSHIAINGSILSTKISNPKNLNPSAFHCQLPSIIGHTNTAKKFTKFFMNDFFAFMPKNGTFLPEVLADGTFKPTRKNNWEFATSQERDNFVSFLKTDFARFCLALRKFNKNLSDGFFTMVPNMDWNRAWTDDDLFNHFNLDQNTRQFILDFIPDFH